MSERALTSNDFADILKGQALVRATVFDPGLQPDPNVLISVLRREPRSDIGDYNFFEVLYFGHGLFIRRAEHRTITINGYAPNRRVWSQTYRFSFKRSWERYPGWLSLHDRVACVRRASRYEVIPFTGQDDAHIALLVHMSRFHGMLGDSIAQNGGFRRIFELAHFPVGSCVQDLTRGMRGSLAAQTAA